MARMSGWRAVGWLSGALASGAVLALALAASGCGSDGDGGDDSTPGGDDGVTPTATVPLRPVDETLARGLLTLRDLPPGWQVRTEGAGSRIGLRLCDEQATSPIRPFGTASVDFVVGQTGPFLTSRIEVYAPGEAAQVFADISAVAAAPTCTTRAGEQLLEWDVGAVALPPLGDESVALQSAALVPGIGDTTNTLVLIRRGDRVSAVVHLALDEPPLPLADLEAIARRADERLAEVGATEQ